MRFLQSSVIILTWTCFCLLFGQQVEAGPKSALELSIIFDKDEYKVKDPIYINFKLKNTKNKPIYVNKRFHINSESSKPEDREVYLRVSAPSGKMLPYKASAYDVGLPKTDYFVLLQPQEEVSLERQKNLKTYFDLTTPGTYSIKAIYQNIYGAEIGVDAFKGRVISNPVKIKIVE